MYRESVSSSNIRAVGYDPRLLLLEIEFHSGSIYQYSSVPQYVHDGLMSAGSKGQYFHGHIRGVYPFEKVS